MHPLAKALVLGASLQFAACGAHTNNNPSGPASPLAIVAPTPDIVTLIDAPIPAKGSGTVLVLYAGSLVATMENGLGPAFGRTLGYEFQGEGKGSLALANEIKDKLRQPDVFIS